MKRRCWKKPARRTGVLAMLPRRPGGTAPEGPGARAMRRPDLPRRHQLRPPQFPMQAGDERARRPRWRRLRHRAALPLPPKISLRPWKKATRTAAWMPTIRHRPRSPPPSAPGRGPVVSVWLPLLRPVTSRQDPPSQGLSSRSLTQHLCLAAGWMVSTEPAVGIDCSPLPIPTSWAGGTVYSPLASEPMLARLAPPVLPRIISHRHQ